MGDELKFQQRWEYRRRHSDFDSSSNDSKYSLGGEPACKKHKLALVPIDNGETSEVSRFGKKGKNDPGVSGKNEHGTARKGKRGQNKKENLSTKRGSRSRKEISRKGKTNNASENAALNDLKSYMHSLLEELKVTRKNLLSWMREEMQKLVAEEKDSESERKEVIFEGEKVQSQYQNNSEENAEVQYQNLFGKNIQVQPQNKLAEYGQAHNQSKFKENVHMQYLINLEENIGVPQKNSQENVQLQNRNKVRSSTRARTCNGRPPKRCSKSKKSVDSDTYSPILEDQIDYSRAIVLVEPTEENGKERLALADKSNSKSSVTDQNMQQQKSIVLAIRAQNGNSGSSLKSAKGKKTANSSNHFQLPDYQVNYSRTIGSITSAEKDKGERPDTSSFSYLQQRTAQNQPAISSERSNMMFGSSSHLGYFQGMQPAEERSRNYAKLSSRDISFFNQNSTTTSILGDGFTVPLQTVSGGFSMPNQFDMENLPRENNNTLGLTMNGGAIRFSGGGYSLPEPYIANNFHGLPNYRVDGRLMTFEDGYRFPNRFNC
ncbi:uncharacterized protein LOC105645797 isoform X2 [Jatropha curcas]|uniref:uncharacterized protein LOC105645797 isoform X2 n=1 Tax=Jatropha curcas TaxID=180498 RepID=UPI001893788C|nr:uncharacterized protein LOC105645797 isoform X2 [Jatropha curcas]